MIASESPRHGGDSLRSLNLRSDLWSLNIGKVQRGLGGTGRSSPTELKWASAWHFVSPDTIPPDRWSRFLFSSPPLWLSHPLRLAWLRQLHMELLAWRLPPLGILLWTECWPLIAWNLFTGKGESQKWKGDWLIVSYLWSLTLLIGLATDVGQFCGAYWCPRSQLLEVYLIKLVKSLLKALGIERQWLERRFRPGNQSRRLGRA